MIRLKINLPPKDSPIWNIAGLRDRIVREIDESFKDIKEDFDKTHDTWDTEVNFKYEKSDNGRVARFAYYTDNKVYGYVNNGTKPHRIPKSGVTYMRFDWAGEPGHHIPRTHPRTIASGDWDIGGLPVRWSGVGSVNHPGIEARNFDEVIAGKHENKINERIKRVAHEFTRR